MSQSRFDNYLSLLLNRKIVVGFILLVGGLFGGIFVGRNNPDLFPWVGKSAEEHEHAGEASSGADEHDHAAEKKVAEEAGHGEEQEETDGHDEAAHATAEKKYDHVHDEASSLSLSKQAKENIGVRLATVELRSFERTISVPGIVVERPGWSRTDVTAPMTGIISHVYPLEGESVQPGQKIFDIRLTHEDLLQKQTDYLKLLEEADVLKTEIARLERVAADGAIAGKTLLERQYEQQKLQADLRAQHQALLLHGLTQEQIDNIISTRNLLQTMTIYAPEPREKSSGDAKTLWYQVQDLKVSQGTYVTAGSPLCKLSDYAALYIEGKAFEQDVPAINVAAAEHRHVSADFASRRFDSEQSLSDLDILFLDDKVDIETRTFRFFVALPNPIVREDQKTEGRRFVYWAYKPGQRMQIKVPVERWDNRIVLPAEAVASEGSEYYIFEANGDHFDRRSVRLEYSDPEWAVVANDGTIKPGCQVAASAAHQMQLALKNKSGGGVDPHAGHNH